MSGRSGPRTAAPSCGPTWGSRANRRHRPGRAFERTDYRFDIVSDYGAFRDLQRHRMLSIEWQPLTPSLGYDVPDVVVEAGFAEEFEASLARCRDLYDTMVPAFPHQAPYAVALAFRIRYVMQMNAREAMHVIELRSGPQGHPAYRRVAQQMHRLIAERAGHRLIAEAMSFVDHGEHELERLAAERRAETRRASLPVDTERDVFRRCLARKTTGAVTREDARTTWWTAKNNA